MELIQLNISAIRQSDAQNNAYVLLLNETIGERQLPVVIGWCEARAIAVALENKEKPERPLTHDLFKSFGDKFNISVSKMVIHKLIEGVFHSTLHCKNLITNESNVFWGDHILIGLLMKELNINIIILNSKDL